MRFSYKDNLPIVKIKVIGNKEIDIDSHIDFASSKTIIPISMAEEIGLRFSGYDDVATGGGVVALPTFEAKVEAFGKRYDLVIGSLDLPDAIPIRSLLDRDVLDMHKVCLNGKRKEIEVSDP